MKTINVYKVVKGCHYSTPAEEYITFNKETATKLAKSLIPEKAQEYIPTGYIAGWHWEQGTEEWYCYIIPTKLFLD